MSKNSLEFFIKKEFNNNNKISKSILYIFQDMNEIENNIIQITQNIQNYMNNYTDQQLNLDFIYVSYICFLNSINILLDLPHMRDKVKYKNRPSIHIIFGEVIAQLASISLISYSVSLMNNHIKVNNIRQKILETVSKNPYLNFSELIDVKDTKLFQSLLQKNYENNIQNIYSNVIETCFLMYSEFVNSDKIKNLITLFNNYYVNNLIKNET